MAISRLKTWVVAEILTTSDLNAEFDNFINYGQNMGFPRTSSADFNGQTLILDADGDTSMRSSTDDEIDIAIGGTDIFKLAATGLWISGKKALTSSDLQRVNSNLLRVATLEAKFSELAASVVASELNNF